MFVAGFFIVAKSYIAQGGFPASFVLGRFFLRRHANSLLDGFALQDEYCSYIRAADVLYLSAHYLFGRPFGGTTEVVPMVGSV